MHKLLSSSSIRRHRFLRTFVLGPYSETVPPEDGGRLHLCLFILLHRLATQLPQRPVSDGDEDFRYESRVIVSQHSYTWLLFAMVIREARCSPGTCLTIIMLVALGKPAIEECIQTRFSQTLQCGHSRKGRTTSPSFLSSTVSEASQINRQNMHLLNEFLAVLATAIAVADMSDNEELAEGSTVHFSLLSASIS